jgi:hypothetical protein
MKAKSKRYPNFILDQFTDDLQVLAEGIDVQSAYRNNEVVRVFAQVHAIVGDLPARTEIGTLRHTKLRWIQGTQINYALSFLYYKEQRNQVSDFARAVSTKATQR